MICRTCPEIVAFLEANGKEATYKKYTAIFNKGRHSECDTCKWCKIWGGEREGRVAGRTLRCCWRKILSNLIHRK